jgi:hypothetical protein
MSCGVEEEIALSFCVGAVSCPSKSRRIIGAGDDGTVAGCAVGGVKTANQSGGSMSDEELRPSSIVVPAPPLVLAASAFGLGLATGLLLPRVFSLFQTAIPDGPPQNTIVYDENLPRSLARREPAPYPGQPRYGGTGSLGVSPRSVNRALGHVERTLPSHR